ncbi:MAG: T9SS type A sorting domain-containing protein, partial [Saprospiraceae bacterium]
QVTFYPNPVSEQFFVNVFDVDFQDVYLEIYDVLGRRIEQVQLTQPEQAIDVGQLNAGWYTFRVIERKSIVGKGKFVKK